MKSRTSLFILLIALLSINCDPGVRVHWMVDNRSSYDIQVIQNNTSYSDTFLVLAETVDTIDKYNGLGAVEGFRNCQLMRIDSSQLLVLDSVHLSVNKNLQDSIDWNFTILQMGSAGGGTCDCDFIITENDIF